jgi:hypothetical protein
MPYRIVIAFTQIHQCEMTSFKTYIVSLILSLFGLSAVLLIWIAGTHKYGAIAKIGGSIGILNLLAISFVAYAGAFVLIWKQRARSEIVGFAVSGIILFVCFVPFAFFLFVLFVRYLHGVN